MLIFIRISRTVVHSSELKFSLYSIYPRRWPPGKFPSRFSLELQDLSLPYCRPLPRFTILNGRKGRQEGAHPPIFPPWNGNHLVGPVQLYAIFSTLFKQLLNVARISLFSVYRARIRLFRFNISVICKRIYERAFNKNYSHYIFLYRGDDAHFSLFLFFFWRKSFCALLLISKYCLLDVE